MLIIYSILKVSVTETDHIDEFLIHVHALHMNEGYTSLN